MPISQNPLTIFNPKHIDVRQHFLRELVGRKEISIIHAPPVFQHSDFVTKTQESFECNRDFVINLWRILSWFRI